MKSILATIASVLAICAFVVPVSFAQGEGQSPDEDAAIEPPASPTLNVVPAGIARQPREDVRDVVLSVPSPRGAPLTNSIDGGFAPYRVAAILNLDGQFELFDYDCNSGGRCRGFATDIWRSLPRDEQQAYADSILEALIAAFPIDRGDYVVGIGGYDARGQVGIRIEQIGTGQRFSYFVGGDPAPAVRPTGSTSRP